MSMHLQVICMHIQKKKNWTIAEPLGRAARDLTASPVQMPEEKLGSI
jgi:hypothetical protein